MAKKKDSPKTELVGFLGVGLDNRDGETRITRSEHFVLLGGSQETHEQMQDTAVRFDEKLRKRGKKLPELSAEEAVEILRRSQE